MTKTLTSPLPRSDIHNSIRILVLLYIRLHFSVCRETTDL